MLSAPPTPAAKQEQVARNWLTQMSRLLIDRDAVAAPSAMTPASSLAPQASATRAQSRRAARSLAITWKTSVPTESVKPICRHAASMLIPAPVITRR